ncbi:MAG: molybdopterin-dependent oxidoreductase [Microscillaceae bacterium]
MTETKHTFCRICEALCGLEVQVENGKITQIRPDDQHVATRGFACAKGLKQHHLYDIPDRLMYPLKKVGTQHVRISWEQALLEIGTKVNQIRKLEHPNSVGMYVGTAAGFGVLHPVFAQGFMTGLGSKSMYASATQDCSNKFAVAQHIYGFPFTQPFPDIHHTECLIVVGANPVISKWSFLQVPNPAQHLKEMERRGARLFFVDPRRTESAKVAGEHVFIRPGTDVFFYLSFLHELIHTGGIEADRIARFMKGYENIRELAQAWPPERTAPTTHIVPEKLREMVKAYREANGAAFYSSTGVNMGGNGTLAFWIQEIINAISGNLDRRGGTLVGKGVIDFPKFGRKRGLLMQDERSRIGNLTKVNDAFAGGVMADEILTPGPRQLKALFVTGGNPLITMANANRLREAFSRLELLVCLDIQMSETASLAHYVLPCTSPMQRPDLPFIFPLMLGLQVKPYLQATKAIVAPEGEQRDEATIYLDLARACGVSIFGSGVAQRTLELTRKLNRTKAPNGQPLLPQEGMLNFLLRITGQKGFRKLLKHPHGLPRPEHQPGSFLGQRVTTEDGKIHLAPAILRQEAQKLEAAFARELALKDHLKLITKRAVTTHNSWTHNFEGFVQGERQTNYLYMHPEDAQKRGLDDGDTVDVRSQTATVRLPLKLLPDLMPGTVALPHGWGHQASKMQTARRTKGVNVNILAADGPDKIDPVSGMAHLTGIPVEVVKAAGPQAENSWSGLPEDVWQEQD